MSTMDPNPYESPRGDAAGPDQKAIVPRPSLPEGFKDRSTGLVLFGALEIIIGILVAMMIPLLALSSAVQPPGTPATSPRMMIPALLMYVLMAIVFIWLGIGSILARRWARALMLVLSWLWLIGGIFGMVWAAFGISAMFSQLGQQGQTPPGAMAFGMLIGGGCVGCIYVLLPAAFVLFYRSEHVKATCEARDPQVRWTDKCPLPVLAVVLMLAWAAIVMVLSPLYGGPVPMFGVLLQGFPAAVVALVVGVLFGWLTWGTYRLKMPAWWGCVALFGLGGLSTVITFSRVSMMEMYRAMGYPEEQLKMMEKMIGPIEMLFPWLMALSMIVWLGYLIYIRKYFLTPPSNEGE